MADVKETANEPAKDTDTTAPPLLSPPFSQGEAPPLDQDRPNPTPIVEDDNNVFEDSVEPPVPGLQAEDKNEKIDTQASLDMSAPVDANIEGNDSEMKGDSKDAILNSGNNDCEGDAATKIGDTDGQPLNDKNDKFLNDNPLNEIKDGVTKDGSYVPSLNDKAVEAKDEDDREENQLKDEVTKGGDAPISVVEAPETNAEHYEDELKDEMTKMDVSPHEGINALVPKSELDSGHEAALKTPTKSFLLDPSSAGGYDSGTEEEQAEFMKEVETFYRENNLEFKAPKFYKEELNLLKLWRAVIKLGGYDQVTSCKLWRQVGESFRPPKTCTTVSWTFRIFYEKALLEYEKNKLRNGELPFSDGSLTESMRVDNQVGGSQALGSGRAQRDAATRARQGWHSQRLLDNGQVCQPIIKDKTPSSMTKSDKQLKTNGILKRKKPSSAERAVHVTPMKTMKMQADATVIDIGPPADWVKINVQRTSDCFEIYALVPGLLREEVHVQSDPAGRLIISGQPEQEDNPWGVTPFKKVVSLPSRIDPHQTSAVVTLHGQLFVRVPFEQSDP